MAEQPKKAPTAYFLWLADNRAALQKELGTGAAPKVSKLAGERWAKLAADKKAPYEAKAKAAKADYDKALEGFKAKGGVVEKRRRGGGDKPGKKTKDPNAPKKPAGGGYGVFIKKNRDEIVKSLPAGHKVTEVSKAAGVRWKAMTEAQRKPYEEEYATAYAAYQKEMEKWKAANKTAGVASGASGAAAEPAEEEEAEEEEGEEEEAEEDEEVAEPPTKKPAGRKA